MNFPMVVINTYKEMIKESQFRSFLKKVTNKIKKYKEPVKRAKFVHTKVDQEIEKLFSDDFVKKAVSCTKKCTACCHTQVSVTSSEVKLLAKRVREGLRINHGKLLLQAGAKNSNEEFYKISYEMRSCVFLGDNGLCNVYEDRPSVCRTNYVIGPPGQCDTKDGIQHALRLLKTYAADTWIYAHFSLDNEAGALPYLLNSELLQSRQLDK